MSALRELQLAFGAALDGEPGAARARVRDDGIDAATRLAVYANNSWMAFRNTLALAYPVVERLGGEDWFSGAVREYRRAHPSRSGNLHDAGAAFAGFLRGALADTGHEVLADVAELEWAWQEVLVAPDAAPLAVDAFARIDARHWAELRLALHPAARLVASRYPVLTIWQHERAQATDPVRLDAGGERVLLKRVALDVELHRLTAGEHALLAALAGGATFAAAVDAADADSAFDLPAALQRCLRHGFLAALDPSQPSGVRR